MTTVRILAARCPRPWRRRGRLTLAVTPPHGHPITLTVPGGNRADLTARLERHLGITEWRWAR